MSTMYKTPTFSSGKRDNLNSVYTTVQAGSGNWGSASVSVTSLTYSASVQTDLSTASIFNITANGGNLFLRNPVSGTNGSGYVWYIYQDSVGSRTITLDSKFKIPTSATTPIAWSVSAYYMDILAVKYDATKDVFLVVSIIPGYII